MNIKNTTLLSFILTINTMNMYAMDTSHLKAEQSLSEMKRKHQAYLQTPQYANYEKAQKLHEKFNTPETFALMEDAAGQLLEAPESQHLMNMAEQKQVHTTIAPTFSDNVLAKHNAMHNIPEYIQYKEAKAAHREYATNETLYIVELCKKELNNTKECQEWLRATDQEIHVVNHIVESKQFPNIQKTTEPKYALYNRAPKPHEYNNTTETYALLKDVATQILSTEELRTYIHAIEQKEAIGDSIETFSNNVIAQYCAVKKMPEFIEYKAAEAMHKEYNTADTSDIVIFCKQELLRLRAFQECMIAVNQENHIFTNILHPQKKIDIKYESTETTINERNLAWIRVTETSEYQDFQQAKHMHEKYNTKKTLSNLNTCQSNAKNTDTYHEYFKHNQRMKERLQQAHTITITNSGISCFREPKKTIPHIPIMLQSPKTKPFSCLNDIL